MNKREFDFINTDIELYSAVSGYGFVVEKNKRENEFLSIPEINTGFEIAYWYQNENLSEIKSDDKGCYIDSKSITGKYDAEQDRLIPLCFKANVERVGNYKVTVTLYGSGEIMLFAGSRRLVFREFVGEEREIKCSFNINVCSIIPRGKTCLYENKSINIALVGNNVRLSHLSIKKTDCPTLYIAGDSTVTDQTASYPYKPETSYAGWGQMIAAYLPEKIAVSNHAHSGLTVESFRSEGHYAIIQSQIKLGDYLMIQFAHNDQKLMHLKAKGGYRDGVITYIEEARARGTYPIIVTPLSRNSWKADDGSYNDLLEEYASECIEIGKQYKVPVIDLHGLSKEYVISNGLEESKKIYFPKDFTHTNDCGAYLMAGYVVKSYIREIKEKNFGDAYKRLAGMMVERIDEWIPQKNVELPVIPESYRDIPNPEGNNVLFAELERPQDTLTRVEALDMVIKTAKFFPTNVFNDLYEDIVGHEWYAGTVECGYQNGIIAPQMIKNNRFEPDKKITLEEFLVFMMSGYKSRKNLPDEKSCPLDDISTMYCMPYVRAAYSLGVINEMDDLKNTITRAKAAKICQSLNI